MWMTYSNENEKFLDKEDDMGRWADDGGCQLFATLKLEKKYNQHIKYQHNYFLMNINGSNCI